MLDQVLKSYLEYICGKGNVRENVPLKNHTTMRVGGNARYFIRVTTKTNLTRLISALNFIEYPYKIIGGGSNIIPKDSGFNGAILRLEFKEIIENQNFLYADAGASLVAVARRAQECGLGGLEWACGIPGTVGGAVVNNAGAFGGCIADTVPIVDVLQNGKIVSLENADCKFSYRQSKFKKSHRYIVLGAYFALERKDPVKIKEMMDAYTQKRIATQPQGFSSGSVFKNIGVTSAGATIDKLGLKGTRIGGAVISPKHANFIINDNNASAKDVRALITLVKKRVKEAYDIDLETEVELF
jgi:UDP-N-acetylmuramate dehydrogenase